MFVDINTGSTNVIRNFSVEGGHLFAETVDADNAQRISSVGIEQGRLIVKGENDMAKVDLGQVVGARGQDGAAATITIGTVTTGAAGSNASVTNAGTTSAAVLNFTIPRGNAGQNGQNGTNGQDGITPTFTIENGHLYADYDNPYTGS